MNTGISVVVYVRHGARAELFGARGGAQRRGTLQELQELDAAAGPRGSRTWWPSIVIAQALFGAAFAWIYVQGREDKPWLAQGVRYGIAIAAARHRAPTYLIYHVVTPVPLGRRHQADRLRHHSRVADGRGGGLDQSLAAERPLANNTASNTAGNTRKQHLAKQHMANEKRDVLLIGPSKPAVERGLAGFTVHNLAAAKNREAFFGSIGHVRAMALGRAGRADQRSVPRPPAQAADHCQLRRRL